MKLEFWLDYNNPICYKQHLVLESILKIYTFEDFELLYRNYEMIPNFKPTAEHTFYELMNQHYVQQTEESIKMFPGLPKDFKPVCVYDAHRLSHLAKKNNLAFEYHQSLFKAYYVDHIDISNHQNLINIGKRIGLDENDIIDVLKSNRFANSVDSNRENAIIKGIFELPHIRIDGKDKLSGYHQKGELLLHLQKQSSLISLSEHCEGENCQRKKTK